MAEAMQLCGFRSHRALQHHIRKGRLSSRKIVRVVLLNRAEVLALAERVAPHAGKPHCHHRKPVPPTK
jgi:hypothetical protein